MDVGFFRLIFILVLSVCMWPATGDERARQLIDQLLDADPAVRKKAESELIKLGESARDDLAQASRGGDPRLAPRAAVVMLRLPFHRPDDPPEIRKLVNRYGRLTVEERQAAAISLMPLENSAPVLVRLMNDDPSPQVGWFISRLFATQDDAFWEPVKSADFTHASPPLLATAARGWFFLDRPKAVGLLRRVAEMEEQNPTADAGDISLVHDLLAADAIARGDLIEAQTQLRKKPPADSIRMSPVLAFYGAFGPIKGFTHDLETLREGLALPQNLYAMARMFDHPAFAAVPKILRTIPPNTTMEIEERIVLAQELRERGWLAESRVELLKVLESAATAEKSEGNLAVQLTALLRLMQLEKEAGNDLSVAEHAEKSLELVKSQPGGQIIDNPQYLAGVTASAATARLRIAMNNSDENELRKQLAVLKDIDVGSFEDTDLAIDTILGLRKVGQTKEADLLYVNAGNKARATFNTPIPDVDDLNNLAWLASNCDMDLGEAESCINRAIRANPTAYSLIDTAGEVAYRQGKFDRAVELETLALAMRPGDRFMRQQLAKFKLGREN